MRLSRNQKKFSQFFLDFRNLHKIFNNLKKNDEPQRLFVSEIIDFQKRCYLNAQKTSCQNLMDSQHVKRSEKLLKSAPQYFCYIFWSFWKKIASKNSFLAVS